MIREIYYFSALLLAILLASFAFIFLFLNVCRKNEIRDYCIASKMMAATYLIFAFVNFMEFMSRTTIEEPNETLIFQLATLIIAVSQAFLFTYSMILLINALYITRRRIWSELLSIIAFSITGIIAISILPKTLVTIFIYLFTLFYIWLLIKYTRFFLIVYHAHKQELENFYSGMEPERLKWIKLSFFAALGIGVSALFVSLFPHIYISLLCQWIYLLFYVYFAIRFLNYAFTFKNVKQTVVEANKPETEDRSLPTAAALHIETKIEEWIADKGFLQSDLNLNDLSQLLGANNKYLSIYINSKKQMTFREWINDLRIKEAKVLLLKNPDTSIKDISYDLGFGSHAHFGKLFLKSTGSTPQTWRNKNGTQISTILPSCTNNNLRMHDAITLLQTTNMPIKDIAAKVGFGAVRSFQRQFQAQYGMTPKQYRDYTTIDSN